MSHRYPLSQAASLKGKTRDEVLQNIREAIELYIESLEAHNEPVPPPISEEVVEVNV